MPEKIDHRPTFARIRELDKDGVSRRKIAEILEAERFPQLGQRNKWHHSAVGWCLDQIERRAAKAKSSPPVSESEPTPEPPSAPTPEHKSDTIAVHGPYTVEDRRLWALLLHLAGPALDPAAVHQLSVSSVLDTLGLDQEQLNAALDRLTCSGIKWVSLVPPGLTVRAPPARLVYAERKYPFVLLCTLSN